MGDTVLHDNFGKFPFLTFIILKKNWFTYNTWLYEYNANESIKKYEYNANKIVII